MSLPKSENDQELETILTEMFSPPPRADIDAWRRRYPSALAWLNPQRISALSQRRKRMQRIIVLATTTAAAICVWLGLAHFGGIGTGASAFAQTVAQIEKAKTITADLTSVEKDFKEIQCAGKKHSCGKRKRKYYWKPSPLLHL